jgi:hypothetical protein
VALTVVGSLVVNATPALAGVHCNTTPLGYQRNGGDGYGGGGYGTGQGHHTRYGDETTYVGGGGQGGVAIDDGGAGGRCVVEPFSMETCVGAALHSW